MSSFRSALVTGGRSGIGAAIVSALERDGTDVRILDIVDGFDVGDPDAWSSVEAVDAAFLNAGVLGRVAEPWSLDDDDYRRVLRVNIDGVVFGVRRLSAVLERGSAIVVTASLAGLVGMPSDPIYSLTKHALVGFVRSVAPHLETRGIRINMVNPGIADTPMLPDAQRANLAAAGFPLLDADDVAAAALNAARSSATGDAWIVQPGREPVAFRFPGVPGPRVAGTEGMEPPL